MGDEPGDAVSTRAARAGDPRGAGASERASVGSRGDGCDNALAESFDGLYKVELIRHQGPWRGLDDVGYATLEYVNHHRLHRELGIRPPAEFLSDPGRPGRSTTPGRIPRS